MKAENTMPNRHANSQTKEKVAFCARGGCFWCLCVHCALASDPTSGPERGPSGKLEKAGSEWLQHLETESAKTPRGRLNEDRK